MKKVEKKVEETKSEEKNLKEAFALWEKQSKNGKEYFTGKADDMKLVAFVNTQKKNDKEPDFRIYASTDDGLSEEAVASLWKTVSKNNKLYLSGTDNEGKKLIGFYNDQFMQFPNRPFIRVYYKEQEAK